jgi:DNA mismatch repair protein MutS
LHSRPAWGKLKFWNRATPQTQLKTWLLLCAGAFFLSILKGHEAMAYTGILFKSSAQPQLQTQAPAYFADLSLDRVVSSITAGRREYDLKPLFYTPLKSAEEIRFRQEIMRDLGESSLFETVKSFSRAIYLVEIGMQSMEKAAAQPGASPWGYLEKGELLEYACTYCNSIDQLAGGLPTAAISSEGLLAFREFLLSYASSREYMALRAEAAALKKELSNVQYCLLIKDGGVKVRRYDGEEDCTPDIESLFERFRQGGAEDYTQHVPEEPYSRKVEGQVLQTVARLYPPLFAQLDAFCEKHRAFLERPFCDFAREAQFYIAYLEYIEPFERTGLTFSLPRMRAGRAPVCADGMFDLALAEELIAQGRPVVCNDFALCERERVVIVTGPNQGGKTTFARVIGQLYHLAGLGCPVPAADASLCVCDRIFTHFEREENLVNLSGKLQDDLIRIREILENATGESIILINEILASTTLRDAVFIGKRIMDRILELGALCVCVTFLDELASYSEAIVSMVSTVSPDDPTERTYQVVRGPADGIAYAAHIARKFRLTYSEIKERIRA